MFSLNTNGSAEKVIHSFGSGTDGTQPVAELMLAKGSFYGTTSLGGRQNCGALFRLSIDGTHERIIHNFCSSYDDGQEPMAGLVSLNGKLYGTTFLGGVRLPSCPNSGNICDYGTVFSSSI